MCPSLIQIGSKTAEKNSAQTNRQTDKQTDRQTDRHYENNGHLAVNQKLRTRRNNTREWSASVEGDDKFVVRCTVEIRYAKLINGYRPIHSTREVAVRYDVRRNILGNSQWTQPNWRCRPVVQPTASCAHRTHNSTSRYFNTLTLLNPHNNLCQL